MELTLSKRWVERKKITKTKSVEVGNLIEYYGDEFNHIDNPIEGVIKKDSSGLYIKWENNQVTRLNGTDNSRTILMFCGWIN